MKVALSLSVSICDKSLFFLCFVKGNLHDPLDMGRISAYCRCILNYLVYLHQIPDRRKHSFPFSFLQFVLYSLISPVQEGIGSNGISLTPYSSQPCFFMRHANSRWKFLKSFSSNRRRFERKSV